MIRDTPQEVLSRIQKLLRLGHDKGATAAEAATALEKASDLLLRYDLSIEELPAMEAPRTETRIGSEYTERIGKAALHWKARLMMVIAAHNNCMSILSDDRLIVVGRPLSRSTSITMLDIVAPQIEAWAALEWEFYDLENKGIPVGTRLDAEDRLAWCPECEAKVYRPFRRFGQPAPLCAECGSEFMDLRVRRDTWMQSFMLGAIATISTRLKEHRKEQVAQPGTQALVLRLDKQVSDYARQTYALSTKTYRRTHAATGFNSGVKAGQHVSLASGRLGQG